MEYIVIGIATAFNFTIIIKKMRMGRYADAALDTAMFVAICYLFSGTFGALATGAIASALISLYLLWNPFTLSELTESGNMQAGNRHLNEKNPKNHMASRRKYGYIA